MRILQKLVLVFAWMMAVAAQASGGFAAEDAKAGPREKVPTAVAEAIRLLEAKEYETFLKQFVSPDELKKITEQSSLAALAKQFAQDKAKTLLRVLKSIQDQQPTFHKSQKGDEIANFPVQVEGVRKNSIQFVKVGKYWYIHN